MNLGFVRWLAETEPDPAVLGGKGASLARLAAAGFPVPPGFVLTAEAYRRFHAAANLDACLAPVRSLAGVPSLAAVREACQPVLERALATPLPGEVVEALREAFGALATDTEAELFAARSSATAEDGRSASFAGLYETSLGLRTADDVADAVKRCYVALWQPRAVHYRTIKRLGHEEAMAIVVMPLVSARASGVAFTRHPLRGTDEVVIEAAWGLGEAVVSGRVSPDRFVVDRATRSIVERAIAAKTVMAAPREGVVELVETAADVAESPSLDDSQVLAAAELALAIEAAYGFPVDVEFAVDERGTLVALQARPVTA